MKTVPAVVADLSYCIGDSYVNLLRPTKGVMLFAWMNGLARRTGLPNPTLFLYFLKNRVSKLCMIELVLPPLLTQVRSLTFMLK